MHASTTWVHGVTVQLLIYADNSGGSSRFGDRRAPGNNTLQSADHHQVSNELSVAMTG